MMKAPPQFVPQAIMAGVNVGAMNRDEIKALVIGGNHPALQPVAFLVDGAKREADRLDHQALVEGGWVMSADEEDMLREELAAQGMEAWKIEAILAGQKLPE